MCFLQNYIELLTHNTYTGTNKKPDFNKSHVIQGLETYDKCFKN